MENSSLTDQPTFEYDESGKITGYKTKIGGADTVFPFKNISGLHTGSASLTFPDRRTVNTDKKPIAILVVYKYGGQLFINSAYFVDKYIQNSTYLTVYDDHFTFSTHSSDTLEFTWYYITE